MADDRSVPGTVPVLTTDAESGARVREELKERLFAPADATLEDEHLVDHREAPRSVGRPARLWSLTPSAARRFPDSHADLTVDLLESMQAQISLPSGSQQSLTGFQVISRDRLKALDADQLAELAKTDALELAYLHLQSMNNFAAIGERAGAGNTKTN